MKHKGVVVSCFDYSTVAVQPWAKAGYLCYCVDMQHPEGETRKGNIILVGCDINQWEPPNEKISFASFFPPCTDVAVSGAKWFKGKGLYALRDAIDLFARSAYLAEKFNCPYYIENPVSTISTYWRQPDYTFNPHQYAGYRENSRQDAYTKKTCLWVGGGFVMPKPNGIHPFDGSKMHRVPPSAQRANMRSKTPEGFANAVFYANHKP